MFQGEIMLLRDKNLSSWFALIEGADQPGHPRRQIRAFVIRVLVRIKTSLAAGEISIFLLVSKAEETGLSLALSETPKSEDCWLL